MKRLDILRDALAARNDAVLMYQINIDNYCLAIEHMATMSAQDQQDLSEFRQRLINLLATERLEQKKEMVMRDVISKQVDALAQVDTQS
jgi:hypothetical protein